MESRAVTRDDVAKVAGVSPATVSHVVNNGPRQVSKETRQKVLSAIKALDYRPNAIARNLRMQKTNSIGLIIPDNKNTFFSEIALGVEQVAFDSGYIVFLGHSAYRHDRELSYINMFISQQAAGVIWIPGSEDPTAARNLENFNIPYFLLDRVIQGVDAPSITVDNFHAALWAVQHLIELGHQRIAFIKRPTDLSHSIDRLNGYMEALNQAGISFNASYVVPGGFLLKDGYEAGQKILALSPRPTAIIGYNDLNAIGAMKAVQVAGLRVPEDVSVVGIDDIAQSEYSCPSMTSVRIPEYKMGSLSAELLIQLINKKLPEEKRNTCLQGELIVRDSTAPPPPSSSD